MKINKFYIIFIIFLFLTTSCKNVSEGFTGTKRSKSSEEFLVQKKNPLVMPPGFEDLPPPKPQQTIQTENDNAVENLFKIYKEKDQNSISQNESDQSLEESILEKINKN